MTHCLNRNLLKHTPLFSVLVISVCGAESAPYMDEMTITGTRSEQILLEEPVSITVINQEQVRKMTHSSVADMLVDVPGVQITDLSARGAPRIMIRGERGSRTLLLIDGQKVSENKSMDGAPILMNPANIERIEIIKGPASVLYGSEAIGGVVNIITKKGGTKPLEADLSALYNSSDNGRDLYAALAGSNAGFDYRISYSDNDHGDLETPDGTLEGSSWSSKEGRIYLGYHNDSSRLGFSYDKVDRDIEASTPAGVTSPMLPYFQLALPEWSSEKAAFFYDLNTGNDLLSKVHADIYHQETFKEFHNYMDFSFFPGHLAELRLITENQQTTMGGTLTLEWDFHPAHHLITGIDYLDDDLVADDFRDISETPPFPPIFGSSEDHYRDKADMQTFALYAQDKWTFNDDWSSTFGVRYTSVDAELSSTTDPNLASNGSDDSHTVGSVAIMYTGWDGMTLRANFGQGYRHPSLQQLFIGTVHGSSRPTYPNPDLQPETSDNFEIGFRSGRGALTLDTALFYNKSEDYITTTPCDDIHCIADTGSYYSNINRAETLGLEMFLSYVAAGGWNPYANITWLDRTFKSSSFETDNTGDPSLMGRVGVRYNRGFDNNINGWMDLYVRGASSADTTFRSRSGPVTFTSEGWGTLNLSLGAEFGKQGGYRIVADLNNLGDKVYEVASSSLPSAGRHIVVKLEANF